LPAYRESKLNSGNVTVRKTASKKTAFLKRTAASKKTKFRKTVFHISTLGLFILLIIILGFAAGIIRGELVLTLSAAIFLAVWAYCLAASAFAALLNNRRARNISVRLSPQEIAAGEQTELVFTFGLNNAAGFVTPAGPVRRRRFFRLPAILVRYRLHLYTRDERIIEHEADPDLLSNSTDTLTVKLRGAWFSKYDELAVFDAAGFFCFSFRIPQPASPRLLTSPAAAEEAIPVTIHSGGEEQRSDQRFERTDNLIEHRPYVPGDDPRRINWKLYSHGGELFVREGEREPPPHSHLYILIDTESDPALYTASRARTAVDLLCENGLAASLACIESGMDVVIGYSGAAAADSHDNAASKAAGPADGSSIAPTANIVKTASGTAADTKQLATALSWPFAVRSTAADIYAELPLPRSAEDLSILILALPRTSAGESSLDRFLQKRRPNQNVDIVFLYEDADKLGEAARSSATVYGQKSGVKARAVYIDNVFDGNKGKMVN
jgi:hypothetical protein